MPVDSVPGTGVCGTEGGGVVGSAVESGRERSEEKLLGTKERRVVVLVQDISRGPDTGLAAMVKQQLAQGSASPKGRFFF